MSDEPRHRADILHRLVVRPVRRTDYDQWRPLWDGYNHFYGRSGPTALPEQITATTWERFHDPAEPICALIAEADATIVGLTHFLYHLSTTRLHDVCYLQDLYTAEHARGLGVGRRLIQAVYAVAQDQGCCRVYWQTQTTNQAGRALYDQIATHHGFIVYTHDLK